MSRALPETRVAETHQRSEIGHSEAARRRLPPRCYLITDFPFLSLSSRTTWEVASPSVHFLWHLEGREACSGKLLQFLVGWHHGAFLEHHSDGYNLAKGGMRHSKGSNLRNGEVFEDRILHFSARNVLTTPNDDLLRAVHDEHKAAGVRPPDVTSSEPQFALRIEVEHLSGLVGLLPVSLHHGRTAEANLPDLAHGQHLTSLPQDGHICVHRWHTTRLGPQGEVGRVHGDGQRAGLRKPISRRRLRILEGI
mmetsp:Transcript_55157/g.147210  ORF Transcript_55157/g.147210 Transcript_55157/m.147210 type:complete len:251 (+) Transcript_55157:68-820(+)